MSYDKELVKVMMNKEAYSRYASLVSRDYIDPVVVTILDMFGNYYTTTATDKIIISDFIGYVNTVASTALKPEKVALILSLLADIEKNPAPTATGESILRALIDRYFAREIAFESGMIAEGKAVDMSVIKRTYDKYLSEAGKVDNINKYFVEVNSIKGLVERVYSSDGLHWPLTSLEQAVGPLRKGDFAVIGARPETGKTSMLTFAAAHMANQTPYNILWATNEEAGQKVYTRFVQASTGLTIRQIEADPVGAEKLFLSKVGSLGKLRMLDKADLSVRDIEEALSQEQYGLIVIDQLRKVHSRSAGDGSEVQRLGRLYQQAREWSKMYAPVITVHQARGDAHGVLFPQGNQLEGSQTEVQGECDLQIMMGRSFEKGHENHIGLNIVRNKLTGSPKTIPALRHCKIVLDFDRETAQFVDKEIHRP